MPFRHLLFNRRNLTAPQRQISSAEAVSLDSVRYWSLDAEFPTQTWPTDGTYQNSLPPHSADVQDVSMSKQPQSFAHIYQPFDPNNVSSTHATYGRTYQPSLSDYDSHSLPYSDLLDTDVSSISQGSVHSSASSTSYQDMMFDEDFSSTHSLSRKSSLVSNTEYKAEQERLCPLLTGQVGKCNPNLCGHDAPCLQYINEGPAPIEECVQQNVGQLHISNPVPTDFTTPRTSPQAYRHHSHSTPSLIQHNEPMLDSTALPTSINDVRQLSSKNRTSTKASSSNDENPKLRQNRKVRARQAHSLVERKYRENLNAKIYELHQLLQHTASNRARQASFPNGPALSSSHNLIDTTEQGEFDDADDKSMLKVKKSDVLVEAISYVHKSEAEMTRMQEQIQLLRERIQMMEEWIRRGDQR